MRTKHTFTILALLVAASVGRAQAASDDDAKAIQEARATIATFKRTDAEFPRFLDSSAGYAVFPTVGKGGLGVGAAHGSGVLFDRTGKPLGRTKLNQVTVGLQAGGQAFSEVIVFETAKAMSEFQSGNFALAAQASAVAIKNGASASAKYKNGVAVFSAAKGGLMFEASVGGQKFHFTPFDPAMQR
jgi:lipid-binding SYLF domain-containing protein